MSDPQPTPAVVGRSLTRDFRLLVILFVMFRLITAIVYQPYIVNEVERGLTTWGDLRYHYDVARQSADGHYPYADFWYEYPPLFPALSVALYRFLALRGAVDYTAYASALGLILLAADAGNLLLIRRIARRLYGDARATELCWVYALLPMFLVLNWWTFDGLIALFLLLGLALLLEGRMAPSGAATAAGTLTKFVPAALLPAVWRFRPRREALLWTGVAAGATLLALVPLLLAGGEYAAASLTAQFSKASYQTVWALLDGNLTTGIFGSVPDKYDAANAYALTGNPAVIPWWLRLIPFAAIGMYIYTRRLRDDDRGVLAFATITLVLFVLWSQGWSPQWMSWLAPLLLLCFPQFDNVVAILILGLLAFVEYPMLFGHTGDTAGALTGPAALALHLTVTVRTVLLVGYAAALYRLLTSKAAS